MDVNMSVNSSSFDDPPLPPHNFSNSSSSSPTNECFSSKMTIYVFSAFSITCILLLPHSILVLYLGYQRWRKQRSISTASSHCDIFTYHSIVMQLAEFLAFIFFFCGGYINLPEMMWVGSSFLSITSLGLALLQLLTCVERYLAVVHPVTYLGLRQAGGVRIRNISIGCVWLLCFGWMAVSNLASSELTKIFYYCGMVLFLSVVSFCSISVLCALKRPGPGEVGGNRERVDQSKQRAFYTIMAIMGVLLLRFVWNLFSTVMYDLFVITDLCLMMMSTLWFDLPSSLVLPLLFLHRAEKLQCCKQNTESG